MPNAAGDLVVGVLGIQGSIREHIASLKKAGVLTKEVLTPEDLNEVDGLVIPGGESSVLSKLMKKNELIEPLKARIEKGFPVYGTCAGMIILSQTADEEMQPLAVMDLDVERNAYGRQVDSFVSDVSMEDIGNFPAVFIRAPQVRRVGANVKVLAKHGEMPILCRQGNLLAGSFHPELTDDLRLHQYFIKLCHDARGTH
ncbi:MAG: pyridoxal 5'-phosphate synthase glutaminase subunit PdxT [Patescibacteria group bacterium]